TAQTPAAAMPPETISCAEVEEGRSGSCYYTPLRRSPAPNEQPTIMGHADADCQNASGKLLKTQSVSCKGSTASTAGRDKVKPPDGSATSCRSRRAPF